MASGRGTSQSSAEPSDHICQCGERDPEDNRAALLPDAARLSRLHPPFDKRDAERAPALQSAIDSSGLIALIASALTSSFATCGWLASFAAAISWVQPSRFARAKTVPSGIFMLRA